MVPGSEKDYVGQPLKVIGVPTAVTLSPDGTQVWVTSEVGLTANGYITIFDRGAESVSRKLEAEHWPIGVAFAGGGNEAWVSNQSSGDVMVLDAHSYDAIGQPIRLHSHLGGIATSPDGKTAYVATDPDGSVSGVLEVIDTGSHTVLRHVPVGRQPLNIVTNSDGSEVYVANFGSGTVTAMSTSDFSTKTIEVGIKPNGLAAIPKTPNVVVSNQGSHYVSVIDVNAIGSAGRGTVRSARVGAQPVGVATSVDGKVIYVCNLAENTITALRS